MRSSRGSVDFGHRMPHTLLAFPCRVHHPYSRAPDPPTGSSVSWGPPLPAGSDYCPLRTTAFDLCPLVVATLALPTSPLGVGHTAVLPLDTPLGSGISQGLVCVRYRLAPAGVVRPPFIASQRLISHAWPPCGGPDTLSRSQLIRNAARFVGNVISVLVVCIRLCVGYFAAMKGRAMTVERAAFTGIAPGLIAAGMLVGSPAANADMWCESGVVALGEHTTCAFASNVATAYASQPVRNRLVYVWAHSPATGINYEMRCVGGMEVTCTGGDGAEVLIRL